MDTLPWFNYVAVDMIGTSFLVSVQHDRERSGCSDSGRGGEEGVVRRGEIKYIPAIRILNDRRDFNATLGTIPPWAMCVTSGLPEGVFPFQLISYDTTP